MIFSSPTVHTQEVLIAMMYWHTCSICMFWRLQWQSCVFFLYWPPLCSCDPGVLNINTLLPTWSAKSCCCSYRVLQMIELSQNRSTMWFFFLVDKDITDTSVLLVPSYPQCSQWGSQLCKHVNHRIEFLEHCANTNRIENQPQVKTGSNFISSAPLASPWALCFSSRIQKLNTVASVPS